MSTTHGIVNKPELFGQTPLVPKPPAEARPSGLPRPVTSNRVTTPTSSKASQKPGLDPISQEKILRAALVSEGLEEKEDDIQPGGGNPKDPLHEVKPPVTASEVEEDENPQPMVRRAMDGGKDENYKKRRIRRYVSSSSSSSDSD